MSDLFISRLTATLATDAQLQAQLSAGAMIINDWVIEMTEIPGGHRLTARRGSDVQTMDIMDGAGAGGTPIIETDETLSFVDGVLSVNTSKEPEPDNTLPITSAAVYTSVGNINALLETI